MEKKFTNNPIQIDEKNIWGAIVFLLVFACSLATKADVDLWWHLRVGDQIWQQGFLNRDLFSWTFTGQPYLNHEWLSQLFLVPIYRFGGVPLLNITFAFIFACAYRNVYQVCVRQASFPISAFISFCAALSTPFLYGARPQILTLFFLSAFSLIVEQQRRREGFRGSFFLIPPLLFLWSNSHGGFMAGVAFLFLIAFSDFVEGVFRSKRKDVFGFEGLRFLLAVSVIGLLLTLLNPLGKEAWFLPFSELGSDFYKHHIAEWGAPPLMEPRYWIFTGLLGIGGISLVMARKELRISDFVLFASLSFFALTSKRHIPLFAVLVAPVIARSLQVLLKDWQKNFSFFNDPRAISGRIGILGMFAIILICVRLSWIEKNIQHKFPVKAVEVIQQEELDALRGFNEYAWGGYLIWKRIPVFIDGRAGTLYTLNFMKEYFDVYFFRKPWDDFAQKWQLDYALVKKEHPLSEFLSKHPDWQLKHTDSNSNIYITEKVSRESNRI